MEPIGIITIIVVVLFLGFNVYLRIKHKKQGISLGCEGCEHAGESCATTGTCPAMEHALDSFKQDNITKDNSK